MPIADHRPLEPEALTIAEAAGVIGRSPTWVRQQRELGSLEPAQINGRQAVTTASLLAWALRSHPGPRLRIVVNNLK